jgi:hypothetical protein
MSQLQLNNVSREIIEHAEQRLVDSRGLLKVVDDYFIQRLKKDEMEHAEINVPFYEGLRHVMKTEVLPLYEQFRQNTQPLRERKQTRKVWHYVLGTVTVLEILEAILTRGRSIVPQVFLPSAILYSFIGFILYVAAQYIDDLRLARARKQLEKSIAGLDLKIKTDVDYDNRRQLTDEDLLHAETVEVLAHYERARDFWRDYLKVRNADPTLPSELASLHLPAFERFLKFHVNGQCSPVARQHRFDRLFIEAHEVLLSRDRENYVLDHLKKSNDPAKTQND